MPQSEARHYARSDRKRIATGFAIAARISVDRITLVLLALLAASLACSASELTVSVVDRSGRGVGDVVVTVESANLRAVPAPTATAAAVMDQRHLAFDPGVLVVAAGTSVEFPNNDSVSHQVYSFSRAKNFQLPLYKGQRHPPVVFGQAGLVVLGCNIHDTMVGYIYVTDAPFFGKTDAAGSLHLRELPAGDYRVAAWSPFIADLPATLVADIHVNAQDVAARRIQLLHDLRSRPEPRPGRADWEY
jgi:plastocyanin